MGRPKAVVSDINKDIEKISTLIVETDDPDVQNGLFNLLAILKSWRRVLAMKKKEDLHEDDNLD